MARFKGCGGSSAWYCGSCSTQAGFAAHGPKNDYNLSIAAIGSTTTSIPAS